MSGKPDPGDVENVKYRNAATVSQEFWAKRPAATQSPREPTADAGLTLAELDATVRRLNAIRPSELGDDILSALAKLKAAAAKLRGDA